MASPQHNHPADHRFMRKAMNAPMLEADHERDLARKWRENGDERALHELTTAYMRLVISVANKFRHYGLPRADLVQEGNVGLMQAAARFDPAREVRFSTYATWWIHASIQDYVLRNWSIVRTGTTTAQKSLFFNLRRLRAQIDDTDDGIMTAENRAWVAEHLGVPERDVEKMASRLSASDRSLNAPMNADGDAQWQDILPDNGPDPEQQYLESHDGAKRRLWLARALEGLNERETLIITQRRLVEKSQTLEALGKKLGISKERVRQIEHGALQKLRKRLREILSPEEVAGLMPDR